MKHITIKGKNYSLPTYLPDATLGVTRSLDSKDLKKVGVEGAVVNTYHLKTTPGLKILNEIGGIKKFMNFDGLITSDSGGWQIFSLIHRHNKPGKITDEGVTFIKEKRKTLFTPEDSIDVQMEIGSDIMICLDDFTSPKATKDQIKESVDRTILWAKRSKNHFEKVINKKSITKSERPLLFAVIQGHNDKSLRKHCTEKLLEIGFDGYGYGGYPMNENGDFDYEISGYTAKLLPDNKPKFALGIGMPWQIAKLHEQGWDIFDCTIPTRDARHGRLFVFNGEPRIKGQLQDPDFYSKINIKSGKYKSDFTPVSNYCDCSTCKMYTKAYLHHLFKINEVTAYRLATIHNLRLYTKNIELLRKD